MFKLLFSFRGTIGRVSFFCAVVLATAFSVLCLLLLETIREFIPSIVYNILLVIVTALIPSWAMLAAYIKRYRSIGVSTFTALILHLFFVGCGVSMIILNAYYSVDILPIILYPYIVTSFIYYVSIPLLWPPRFYTSF